MADSTTRAVITTDGINESQHNDFERTPSNGNASCNVERTSDTHRSAAQEKEGATISTVEPSPGHTLGADIEPSTPSTDCLKDRLPQSSPARRIVTAIQGYRPGLTKGRKPDDQAKRLTRPWKSSFIRFGPLSGIFGMFLALASLVASLGILAGSNSQPVSNWSVGPPTYLAIFTAIANLSVRYAAIQGVVIAWWFRATRGSTLAKLHLDWRSGTTLRGAVTSGRNIGLLGLACIASTVVVVDGPLLQKSSSVVPVRIVDQTIPLNVSMAPEIPRDYTGYWATAESSRSSVQWFPSFNATIPGPSHPVSNYIYSNGHSYFSQGVTRPWLKDTPLTKAVRGCQRNCKAKIQAPALFATNCDTHVLPVDYNRIKLKFNPIRSFIAPPLETNAYTVVAVLDVSGKQETINLFTGYAMLDQCKGTYNYTTCTLAPGIGEYDVSIDGNGTTLDAPVVPKFIKLAENAPVNHTYTKVFGYPSTLAKVAEETIYQWNTAVVYYQNSRNETTAITFATGPSYEAYQLPTRGLCKSWRDPREDVMESLNKLMFYIGGYAASEDPSYLASHMDAGLETNTSIMGDLQGEHNVFHTNYWFFLGAAIVEVVCIALVAPTYWGWWKLGRPCSFSPLEMAKAFGSPMFAECNSNSSGRDLARNIGEVEVKYGTVGNREMGEQTALTFDDPEKVNHPRTGMRFDM